jgi:hypothetical protein
MNGPLKAKGFLGLLVLAAVYVMTWPAPLNAQPTHRALWPSPVISVCWENSTNEGEHSTLRQQELVRTAVEQTWEHESGLRFRYWGPCRPESNGVRILISRTGNDSLDRSEACSGFEDCHASNGYMKLNFTSRDARLKYDAVHEFGHVVGFFHGQDHPQTPSWCVEAHRNDRGHSITPPPDAIIVGGFDTSSVMNYCSIRLAAVLSANDIAAVRRAYPPANYFEKTGDNGTVTGNRYCAELAGNGAPQWGSVVGTCVGQITRNGRMVPCESVPGFNDDGIYLLCRGAATPSPTTRSTVIPGVAASGTTPHEHYCPGGCIAFARRRGENQHEAVGTIAFRVPETVRAQSALAEVRLSVAFADHYSFDPARYRIRLTSGGRPTSGESLYFDASSVPHGLPRGGPFTNFVEVSVALPYSMVRDTTTFEIAIDGPSDATLPGDSGEDTAWMVVQSARLILR